MRTRSGRPGVVLLAEDDPGDQELIRRALEEHDISVDLRIASDGEEALDYLLQRGPFADPASAPLPDLVLLDLNMPKLNGRRVLEHVRSTPHLCRIPVVVLTTSKHHEDVIRCYELGCNSFITKPMELHDFVDVVQKLRVYWFELVTLPN